MQIMFFLCHVVHLDLAYLKSTRGPIKILTLKEQAIEIPPPFSLDLQHQGPGNNQL